MKNHALTVRSLARARAMLILGAASLLAVLGAPLPVAAAADLVWVGNDAFNSSDFSNSGNWQSNTLPSWGYGNSLKFNQNQNANVTGLNYNWGNWRDVNDIFWDTTFPVGRTLTSSSGFGINFKIRLENQSSFTQTVTMPLSGGQDGAAEIQLNPVKGSLILSGTIFNDNSKNYTVYGSQDATVTNLTLNTALGPNAPAQANVNFTVAGGRNSAVQVNASQVWAGATTVNSGSFTTANGVTLASTAIVVGGGTVATTSANTLADTASLTVNTGRLSIGGSDTVASLAGSGGAVDLAAGATLTIGNASSTSYAGSIGGSGNLTKVGSGTLTLLGANANSGGTTVSAGRLVGTTSSLQGSITNNAAVTFDQSTSGTYAGDMTGSGSLTKLGSGTVMLSSNFSSFSGGVAIDAGVLAIGSANALGSTGTISFGGGTLQYSPTNKSDFSGRFSTAANQQFRIDTNGRDVTFASNLASENGQLVKLGSGRLTLSGSNSYSGGTSVTAGRVVATTSHAFPGNVTNNAEVEFRVDGGGIAYGFGMSGSGSVTKTGAGVLEFTAANTYTGLTSVNDGGLRLNGSIAGGLNVALVASLSGTGTVGGNATIIGTHSPGNSPGAQTFNGNLTYQAGAVVNWELIANTSGGAGTNFDQIILPTGDLNFAGSTTLALSFNGTGSSVNWANPFWNANRSWMVYDLAGGTLNNLGNLVLGGSLLDSLGNSLSPTARGSFTISNSGQDVMLNFVAVPEPATYAMALAGVACGGFLMWRRRRCSP